MDMFPSSSSSSSSSDDEEHILNLIIPEILKRHPKNEGFAEHTVPLYSEKEFKEHFRVSKSVVNSLVAQFEQSALYPKYDTGHARISPEKCILVFLWYAGHEAASFRDVADRFNISISTLSVIIENLSLFISNMSSSVITWPGEAEQLEITEDFQRKGFRDVLGCMDGSHIRIDTPSEDSESYLNRKKFYSIQMQAVCDNKRKIRDVFIGYPGSVHDSRVFKNSTLFNTINEKCNGKYILADSAYPCLRNVLTPYRDNGALTPVEKHFNRILSHCRILIEHTFGMLKQKFRQLYHLKLRSVTTICHFIRACCVLHNLSVDEDADVEWEQLEDEIINNFEENRNEENEGNPAGHDFRNYIASVLYYQQN